MSKVKLLTIAVVVLVVVNIVVLSALYFGRHGHPSGPRGEGPKALIIERLHFDAGQVAAYEVLITEHQQAIQALDGQLLEKRNTLYQGLKVSDWAEQDALLAVISNVEQSIDSTHFAHFAAIGALCRPDQQLYFEELVEDLAGIFRPPGPNQR